MEIIFGAAVSLLVQWLKQHFSNEWQTLAVLLVLSLAAAGIYTVLVSTGYYQAFVGIIMTAALIYTWIIARFESDGQQPLTDAGVSPDQA